jgi:hypothetical protein
VKPTFETSMCYGLKHFLVVWTYFCPAQWHYTLKWFAHIKDLHLLRKPTAGRHVPKDSKLSIEPSVRLKVWIGLVHFV